ncbi:MAG: zinc ribbon domain-containing protein [Cyanobacteria bacterium]|nr:zinc ribbon domain-containing protein [Cyanobacteriota bacterium]
MFCQGCGSQLGDTAAFCSNCGDSASILTSSNSTDIGRHVKVSSRDALTALKQLALNPVGGLPIAYGNLGDQRALSAGLAMCVAFALASSAGMTLGANQIQSLAFNWFGPVTGLIEDRSGFSAFLSTALQFLVLPASIAAASLALRKMAGAKPPIAADVFTAGAALAPFGLAMFIGGLIGIGNAEITLLLFFFAITFLILMLYSGFTSVGQMTDRAGAPAVPAAILISGWLCKVVFAAFI